MLQVGLNTAKWLAPASWLFNFACQQYGMNSSPNMKDIADRNHSFFSPQPFFIAGFFFPQTIIQLCWLYRLVRLPNTVASESDEAVKYSGVYALGNVAIGVWMIFWNNSRLDLSNACVIVNSLSQLYYVANLLPPASRDNWLTHVVAKMFAGIGLLDLVDNTSSWLYPGVRSPPHFGLTSVATAVVSTGVAAVSDPIMAACTAYDLLALAQGQIAGSDWQKVLYALTAVTSVISASKWYAARGFVADIWRSL
ncbi:hypothetical protein PYCC9005_003508 [Savitreella phatthalungensis]